MHPLVRRQLRKAFGDAVPDSAELRKFIASVDDAYAATEADRKQLENSLELASAELFERNGKLEDQLEEQRRLERVVAQRNRDMALILDNVAEGLVTVGLDGALSTEQSKALGKWFGPAESTTKLWTYLAGHDPNLEAWMELGFESLREDEVMQEIILSQLPSRIERDNRQYQIEYRSIGQPITLILIVVKDITEELAHQRAERAQRELIAVVERAYRDRAGFLQFFNEASEIVRACEQWNGSVDEMKRLVHTLKGNSALFGVMSVSEICHEFETRIDDTGQVPDAAGIKRLAESWRAFYDRVNNLLGLSARKTILVDWEEYQAVLALLGDPEPGWAIQIRRWGQDATRAHLERFAEQAHMLSKRLGKAEIDVEIDDNDLRLDGQRFGPVWSALIHSVRNAISHGIEPEDVRRAAGKHDRGRIRFSTVVRGDDLWIELQDDGAGIDWAAVEARARALGLPAETSHELSEAVFASGMSTASELTQESGRGVGMGALRAACVELGGTVELSSQRGHGTTIRCRIPLTPQSPRRQRATQSRMLIREQREAAGEDAGAASKPSRGVG